MKKKSDLETINITEDNFFELSFPNRNDKKQLFPKGKVKWSIMKTVKNLWKWVEARHMVFGVMGSTLYFESKDPSSNLGRT